MSLLDWCLLHCIRHSVPIPTSFPTPIRERERLLVASSCPVFTFLLENSRQPRNVIERFALSLLELWLTHDLRCRRWLGYHLSRLSKQDDNYPHCLQLYQQHVSDMHLPCLDNRRDHPAIQALIEVGLDQVEGDGALVERLLRSDLQAHGDPELRNKRTELLLTALETGALCQLSLLFEFITSIWSGDDLRRWFRVEGLVVPTTTYNEHLFSDFYPDLIRSDGFDHQMALTTLMRSFAQVQVGSPRVCEAITTRDAVVQAVPEHLQIVLAHFVPATIADDRLDSFAVATAHALHAKGCLDLEQSVLACAGAKFTQALLQLDYSPERLHELVQEGLCLGRTDPQSRWMRTATRMRVEVLIRSDETLRKLLQPLCALLSRDASVEGAMHLFV